MAGTLRRYGLIGKSLQHSLSPFIHRRLMEAAGIKGEYKLYELEEGELDRQLPQLLAELDGFNCTLPYKQRIIPYLRELAPSARLYGAVNTVHQGVGHNTDGVGFRSCSVPMAGKKGVHPRRRWCGQGAGLGSGQGRGVGDRDPLPPAAAGPGAGESLTSPGL